MPKWECSLGSGLPNWRIGRDRYATAQSRTKGKSRRSCTAGMCKKSGGMDVLASHAALTIWNIGVFAMAATTLAGKWLEENGHKWDPHSGRRKMAGCGVHRRAPFFLCDLDRVSYENQVRAEMAGKRSSGMRTRAEGERFLSTVKFVKDAINFDGDMCLFVPFAKAGSPVTVSVGGKQEPAARYVCRVVNGNPEDEAHVARHLCGNGHLSCINPKHLVWGTHETNAADKALHRATPRYHPEVSDELVDAICADTRHPNVMAISYQIHTIVILSIKAARENLQTGPVKIARLPRKY